MKEGTAMKANDAYQWLIASSAASTHDRFDIHAVASIFALALDEVGDDRSLVEGVGLDRPAVMRVTKEMFPGALAEIAEVIGEAPVVVDEEEQSLRDILAMFATGASPLEGYLVAMIARRCASPHHLWQDLGLRDRLELSQLMRRHFSRLADKNRQDMKWKKFLYRMVCGSEGFTLCTAPVCSECDDFANCFGAEDGESRLARARNGAYAAV
jgi:nitrogen fixation protein NifQ